MEFNNYEFESLHIISETDAETLSPGPTYDTMPECQLMLHEFMSEQEAVEGVPISIIQNCLDDMEK